MKDIRLFIVNLNLHKINWEDTPSPPKKAHVSFVVLVGNL